MPQKKTLFFTPILLISLLVVGPCNIDYGIQMDPKHLKKRAVALRRRMKKQGLRCLIVTSPPNVTYLTGFSGDDSWAIVTDRDIYLITDSRYTRQANLQCPACHIIERKGPIVDELVRLLSRLRYVRSAAIEKSTPLAVFESLGKKSPRPVGVAASIVEPLRATKDSFEIAAIRLSCRIAAKAFKQTIRFLETTITENELAGILDYQIRRLGAKSSFETIVAFGPNAALPHHQPTGRKLKKDDTVLVDFGVRFKGYCCDLTRCFAVGKVDDFYRRVYRAVKLAQATAMKMIKPGAKLADVDAAARAVLAQHNLPVYGHGTGHGLGLQVHEDPILAASAKGTLQPGHVITVEPAVYIPGTLGIRLEDDVLVTQTGRRILTRNCHHRLSYVFPKKGRILF